MIELLLAAEQLLAAGRLDQAERLFEQVAEADPQNAIAVVGLARVALERSDEAGALATARRALEIDPEEAAARRMIDRLQVVAATRAAPMQELAAEPAARPEPDPVAAAELEPAALREPIRRSWLDRLIGLFRRR